MISDYFIFAFRNLKKRKLRSFLTILGILIAISTIFILISLSLGLENFVEEQFRILGTDKIFIQPRGQLAGPGTGGAVQLTKTDVDVISKVRGVKDYSYWIASPGQIEFNGEKRFFTIISFPLDKAELFKESGNYNIDEGNFLKKGDSKKAMVGSQYKYNNIFKKPIGLTDKIKLNGVEFEIKAIIKPLGNPIDDKFIYISEKDFRELFPKIDKRIDTIIVQIEPGENVNDVVKRLDKEIFKHRNVREETRDFIILTPEELLETFRNILNIITVFLVGIATISLIIGGIGIANTMYTSVLERTKEIGVMKAIGAKNSDIIIIFLIESGLLGMIGGIIGIALGFGINFVIELVAIDIFGTNLLQTVTPPYLIFGLLIFAFFIGAISGSLPAIQASRVKPTQALRYE